jgi:thiamine-phosphate pyrophosphorylase
MRLPLPKIYPLTDTVVSGLSHTEQVRRLLAGGATLIQLREKRAPARTFFDEAIEAARLAHAHGAKLIINDRVDIAISVHADGVHLGQDDMPVEAARRLLGEQAIIGFSTHNLEQVKAALDLPIDYLAFGPVFSTTSKDRPDPVVGLEGVRDAGQLTGNLPIVAIGGITLTTLNSTLRAGAGAVALISAVLAGGSGIAENLKLLTNAADSAN